MIRSVKIAALLVWSGLMLFPGLSAEARTVRYELTVRKMPVNMSGRKTVDFALSVNGSIPAPTLEFTEGDDAEITVNNEIGDGQELSIHWHGILLPPLEDGVSYVNTPPILAGTKRIFRFKIRQHGTYWYHSHTGLQEQKGVYGAFVIHPKKNSIDYDRDVVAVLSDWSDENADQILKNLRKDGDYYLFKKNSVRSYAGAIKAGKLGSLFANEWMRMGGMDLSDVGYDAFLINGKRDSLLADAKPGEKIRIRIVNAAASSYFYVSLGNQNMRVIAADGVDVDPVDTREIMIGMAETYDVLFTVPDGNSYELRATCQDVTGHASAWIGSGAKVPAPDKPLPDFYAEMDHGSHQGHAGMDHSAHTDGSVDHSKMDHSKMDHSKMDHGKKVPFVDTLTVDGLISKEPTAFASDRKVMDLKLSLGGDMERYVWHINGKAIHEDRTITIQEGDVIRFTFQNETMMHHPMHLHGHFFRVVGAQGDRSPLKHTVDVPPHGSRTIEFLADEPGEWMLHCHNLYHMKTGMARVIKYQSFIPSPEIAAIHNRDPHLHDHFYFDATTFLGSNKAAVDLRVSQMRWSLELDSEIIGRHDEYDAESTLKYRRWLTNFASVYAGGRFERSHDDGGAGDTGQVGLIGISYVLPLLIETDLEIDSEGVPALMLEKRLQWTSWLYSDLHAGFARGRAPDFEVDLMYQTNWHWAAGLTWIDRKAGAGVMFRF
jgi:FtsP/CotA-like multicopper oxidase with cupredoxin domain